MTIIGARKNKHVSSTNTSPLFIADGYSTWRKYITIINLHNAEPTAIVFFSESVMLLQNKYIIDLRSGGEYTKQHSQLAMWAIGKKYIFSTGPRASVIHLEMS